LIKLVKKKLAQGSAALFIIPLALIIIGVVVYFLFGKNLLKTVGTTSEQSQKPVVIGFSMGTLQEERWQKDRDEFLKDAKAMKNVSVDIQASNNDAAKQVSQIESMITKGVNVLVIAPYDARSLTKVVDEAHKAGIKVISYDRLIMKSNVDLYLSFDNKKVGEYEAQYVLDAIKDKLGKGTKLKFAYVGGSTTDNNALLLKEGSFKLLQPLIDSGEIEIVMDKFTADWNPENAYKNLKGYLDESNGAIDAVVCANDGTAFGAIKALNEYHLDGKVPVSGQDAELAACQRIIQGTQVATVYKSIPKLAATGIDLAVKFANGEKVQTNVTVYDGKNEIPSVLLEPIAVTKANMDSTVIKDGYHTYNEVYKK
jgi:D-xylose transport system substrate-binding protein